MTTLSMLETNPKCLDVLALKSLKVRNNNGISTNKRV
jgi:hypothetical protein